MRTLYIIFKFILFPGTYLRGFWEHLTCKITKLLVESTGYLRADEACGHVEHTLAKKRFAAYLISTGPGFMNFNIGSAFFLAGFMNLYYMGITPWDSVPLFIIYILCIYVGISCLCSLFPLTEDILNYWHIAYKSGKLHVMSIIAFPFAAITRLGAFLEKNCVIPILWTVAVILMIVL